ncbi:MAG TPA: hypothetical protein VFO27_12070 [Bryobacteraceae bacterium]|nr:hypothetical protein [Bryobacteraceae bacterium]
MTKANKFPRSYEEHLTREEFRARFNAEKAWVQRHYCTLFKFWRTCRCKPCRRARACMGDPNACLKRCVGDLHRRELFNARQALVAATPRNCPAPEREARLFMANEADFDWRCPLPPAGWQRVSQRHKRVRRRRS